MQETHLAPLLVYFVVTVMLIAGVMAASYLLGERSPLTGVARATGEPFESGIVPVGYARFRLPVKFYLIAMFFVIFDLEAVFIIGWAVVAREAGWLGYAEIFIFIVILLAALIYLWRIGALDWSPKGRRRHVVAD